jgi:hypothetical protein
MLSVASRADHFITYSRRMATQMPSIAWLSPILLGIPVLPLLVLRGRTYLRAREYFVASESTPPGVVQSSSIAYSLQLATFCYLFNLGARGDFWPAIAVSATFGAGLYLIYKLRRPMLAFLGRALAQDKSITIPAFVAGQHGDDPRLRVFAAALTVVAFMGLGSTTALGFASLLSDVFQGGPIATFAISCCMLALTAVYTVPGGNTGTMRSAQVQLGILYFGLFGSILLTLYLLISSAQPMPVQSTIAVAALAACCAVVVIYRRSRYIDTSPIGRPISGEADSERFFARLFRRISRVLNEFICILAATALGLALLALFTENSSTVIGKSVGVSQKTSQMSIPGLTSLALLALFHPIVDMTNWLRIAALDADHAFHVDPVAPVPFSRIIRMYAGGSAIVWLIACMFGTIAVTATDMVSGGDLLKSFVMRLGSQQNEISDTALCLLLVSLCAMASIAMSAMFSASLAVIRYDLAPSIWQVQESDRAKPSYQAFARRRAIIVGCALGMASLVVLCVFNGNSDVSFTSGRFLGLILSCLCAQLAFVPLVLGPLIRQQRGNSAALSPAWAIAVLGVGVTSGVGAVIICLLTDHEAWLWTAVPSCVGSGLSLSAVAGLANCKTA